jgi:hypothetical protein
VKAKLALDNGDIMLALERVMSLETKMRGLASTVEAQGQTLEAVKTLSQPPPPPGAPPPPPSGPPPLTVDVVIEREVKRLWTSVQVNDDESSLHNHLVSYFSSTIPSLAFKKRKMASRENDL